MDGWVGADADTDIGWNCRPDPECGRGHGDVHDTNVTHGHGQETSWATVSSGVLWLSSERNLKGEEGSYGCVGPVEDGIS